MLKKQHYYFLLFQIIGSFLNLNFIILGGVWDDFLLEYLVNLIHCQ